MKTSTEVERLAAGQESGSRIARPADRWQRPAVTGEAHGAAVGDHSLGEHDADWRVSVDPMRSTDRYRLVMPYSELKLPQKRG